MVLDAVPDCPLMLLEPVVLAELWSVLLGGCEEELGGVVVLVAGAFAAGVDPPASGCCAFAPGACVGWLACWSTLPELWAAGDVAD